LGTTGDDAFDVATFSGACRFHQAGGQDRVRRID